MNRTPMARAAGNYPGSSKSSTGRSGVRPPTLENWRRGKAVRGADENEEKEEPAIL